MSAMTCPECGGATRVSNTQGADVVIRFRTCQKCGHRFKTTESGPEPESRAVAPSPPAIPKRTRWVSW